MLLGLFLDKGAFEDTRLHASTYNSRTAAVGRWALLSMKNSERSSPNGQSSGVKAMATVNVSASGKLSKDPLF